MDISGRPFERDSKTLREIGGALSRQPLAWRPDTEMPYRITVHLSKELADEATAAWHRDEDRARYHTRREGIARRHADLLVLVALDIDATGRADGDDVVFDIDAWLLDQVIIAVSQPPKPYGEAT